MKTLVIANQKGGVGKTALVVSLAWDFAERNKKVVVVDLDVQGNCSFTLSSQNQGGKTSDMLLGNTYSVPNPIHGVTLLRGDTKLQNVEGQDAGKVAARLRKGIGDLEKAGFEICLIDSPAAFGVRFMAGLVAADFVLAPIELEAYSMQGIKQLVATFGNARRINPKLKFLGMLANKVDARNPRHRENMEQLRKAYPELLLPVKIGLRGSIAESLVKGKPIWENKKTAARIAAKEMRGVAELVYARIEE